MEDINKVELLGVIGIVNKFATSDNDWYRFSMCTHRIVDGDTPFIQTTWHDIKVLGKGVNKTLTKGQVVHVFGRIERCDYLNPQGDVNHSYMIIANKVIVEG